MRLEPPREKGTKREHAGAAAYGKTPRRGHHPTQHVWMTRLEEYFDLEAKGLDHRVLDSAKTTSVMLKPASRITLPY